MSGTLEIINDVQAVQSHFDRIAPAVAGMMRLWPGTDGVWRPSKGWREDAGVFPLDAEQALKWAQQGIPVAFPVAKGVVAVDLDNKHGANGWETLKAAKAEQGFKVLPGPHTKTKSDGRHLFYRLPEDTRLRNLTGIAPGVDLRAEGSFVRDFPSAGYQPLTAGAELVEIDPGMLGYLQGCALAKYGAMQAVIQEANDFGKLYGTWTANAATEADLLSACRVLDLNEWLPYAFIMESIFKDAEALKAVGVDPTDLAVRIARLGSDYPDQDAETVEKHGQRRSFKGARIPAVFAMAQRLGWQNPASTRITAPVQAGGIYPAVTYENAAPWSDAGLSMLALKVPELASLRIVAGQVCRFTGCVYEPAVDAIKCAPERVATIVLEELAGAKLRYAAFPEGDDSAEAKMAKAAVGSWQKALDRLHSTMGQKQFLEMLSSTITVRAPADQIRHGDYLPTSNGLFDISNGGLLPYAQGEIVTRFCPAFALGGSGERFQALVERLWPDPEERAYAQRALGMALLTGTQRVLLLLGKPRSGKGVLVEAIEGALGELSAPGNRRLVVHGDGEPHGAALLNIRGRRLVTFSEVNQARLSADRIKAVSGGDTLDARFLYSNDVMAFRFAGVLLLTANEAPLIGDATGGLASRLVVIPCRGDTLPEEARIRGFGRMLAESELGSVMSFLLDGAKAFLAGGLRPPQSVSSEAEELLTADDPVQQFLKETMVRNPIASVGSAELYLLYSGWCLTNGEQRPLSHAFLGRRLRAMGFELLHTRGGNRWGGLGRAEKPAGAGGTVVPFGGVG